MTFGSLFSGIGGLDLGMERAGFTCKWQVESSEYCRRVLAKYWPDAYRWDDVCTFPMLIRNAESMFLDLSVDVICGGFPCQDVSLAGNRDGISGSRSGLYGEMLGIIECLRPRAAIIENVDGLRVRGGLGVVLRDLSRIGYDAEWTMLSACQFGAAHTRKRMFIVAYPNGNGLQGCERRCKESESIKGRIFTLCDPPERQGWQQLPAPVFCRGVDGIPRKVDRTRGLGNAVVPAVGEFVGRCVNKFLEQGLPVALEPPKREA